LWDKLKAVELLAREKDVFTPTTVVKNDLTENMQNILLGSRRGAARAEKFRDVTTTARLLPSPEEKKDGQG
jgi:hypothetical protein